MKTSVSRFEKLNDFVNRLVELRVSHRITKIRAAAVLVEVFAPGEHWEVEFLDDGTTEIERYRSDGHIYDEAALAELWALFEDVGVSAASVLDSRTRKAKAAGKKSSRRPRPITGG
ncbi:MAG TPA: hypothetical protein VIN63_06735 [Candidatus Limnocylindria bacterium]|jgi:hypothetical protein